MSIGPVPAVRKVRGGSGLTLAQMEGIELNEAFAAQALAVLREPGLPDDAPHVNPNGGAIAMGHPPGMSGARLVTGTVCQLEWADGRYGLRTICGGYGAGHCPDHRAGLTPSAEMDAPSVKRCIWL